MLIEFDQPVPHTAVKTPFGPRPDLLLLAEDDDLAFYAQVEQQIEEAHRALGVAVDCRVVKEQRCGLAGVAQGLGEADAEQQVDLIDCSLGKPGCGTPLPVFDLEFDLQVGLRINPRSGVAAAGDLPQALFERLLQLQREQLMDLVARRFEVFAGQLHDLGGATQRVELLLGGIAFLFEFGQLGEPLLEELPLEDVGVLEGVGCQTPRGVRFPVEFDAGQTAYGFAGRLVRCGLVRGAGCVDAVRDRFALRGQMTTVAAVEKVLEAFPVPPVVVQPFVPFVESAGGPLHRIFARVVGESERYERRPETTLGGRAPRPLRGGHSLPLPAILNLAFQLGAPRRTIRESCVLPAGGFVLGEQLGCGLRGVGRAAGGQRCAEPGFCRNLFLFRLVDLLLPARVIPIPPGEGVEILKRLPQRLRI